MLAGMSEERLFERLLFLVIALLACLMPVQNDTWWHLRAGDIMLETRRVLLTDVFSHTVSGQPWPNYEWLSEVVFALVYRVGGLPLLTALCAAASTASLWFVYAITPGTRLQRTLLLAGVVSGVTITWSVRPQPLSLLLLGLTLWLLQRRRWAPLPPLFLLWANLHGAVALGGVALLGMIAAYVLRQRSCPPRLAVTAALCGVATLITPLGLHYWPEIVASIGRSRANTIMEWRPPDWPPGNLAFWAAAAALPVLWVTRWNRLKSPEQWALPMTALLMLLIALRSMRNISPFLMIAAPACGALLGTPQLTVPREAARRSARSAGVTWRRSARRRVHGMASLAGSASTHGLASDLAGGCASDRIVPRAHLQPLRRRRPNHLFRTASACDDRQPPGPVSHMARAGRR